MKFSSQAKKLIKASEDAGVMKTYLFAKASGYDTSYFPLDYQVAISKTAITTQVVDEDFLRQWVAQWPTPSQVRRSGGMLNYSVSGNLPKCRERLAKFLKLWEEYVTSDENPYDLIARATERYIERQRESNWEFTKKNFKFILDDNGSTLSEIIEDLDTPIQSQNFYL